MVKTRENLRVNRFLGMADIHLTCLRNEQEIEVRTSIKIEEAVFIMLRFILPLCCILSWWLLSRFPSLFN